jgi:hypothetical protein
MSNANPLAAIAQTSQPVRDRRPATVVPAPALWAGAAMGCSEGLGAVVKEGCRPG